MRTLTPRIKVPTLSTLRSWLTHVGGFGALTAGAYVGLGLWAGLVAGGLSLLVLGWLGEASEQAAAPVTR